MAALQNREISSRAFNGKGPLPLTHGVRARGTVVCVVCVCARWANRTQFQPGGLRLLGLYLARAMFEDSLSRMSGNGAAVAYNRLEFAGTVTVGVSSLTSSTTPHAGYQPYH